MSRTLSGLRREGGISLVIPHWKRASARVEGQSPGFSQVAAGFLSTYDGDLKDPLVGLQGGPVSTRVVMGPSEFLCSRCRCCDPHLELREEPQDFSPGLTLISAFLWAVHRGLGLISCAAMQVYSPFELEEQYQASCRVDYRDWWLTFEATQGCQPAILF